MRLSSQLIHVLGVGQKNCPTSIRRNSMMIGQFICTDGLKELNSKNLKGIQYRRIEVKCLDSGGD